MDIALDEVIHFDGISSASTGAAADADSTPTFAVYEEATDTDIGVGGNMTKRTSLTGNYRGTFTLSAANGFEAGKWYVVVGSATIGGIACKGILKHFRVVAAEGVAGTPNANTTHAAGTAWGSGAITAASIASDAITDAKVASDVTIASVTGSVGSVTGAVGSVTGSVGSVTGAVGSVTGSVGSIATGGITAASFGAGAIDNAAIAANAIGASELAADAASEIAAAVRTELATELARVDVASSTLATAANLATVAGYLDTEIASIVTATTAAAIRSALGLASANLDTQIATLATQTSVNTIDDFLDTEIAAIKAKTDQLTFTVANQVDSNALTVVGTVDDAVLAAIAALSIPTVAQIWTTALTEAYRADGATGTGAQILYEIMQGICEFAISGTTKTVKKIDGSTTAATYTLDSSTAPTSITRAS